jgi:hypothetical protein
LARERVAAALLAVAALVVAPRAQADPVKVAIVHGSEAIPLARRVQAELTALGVEVVDITTATDALVDDAELDAAARLAGATAAIRIAAPSASVWIAGNDGKQYVVRVVPTDHAASSSPDAVLVLRAVELVRVALLDPPTPSPIPPPLPVAAPPPPPPRADATPHLAPDPLEVMAPPPRSRLTLEIAPAVVGSPGGVPLTASLLLGARFLPGAFGPAVFAVLPLFPARVDGPEGTADVRAAIVGAGLHFAPRPPGAMVRPGVEIGLAGVWLLIHGVATTGAAYTGQSDNLLVAAPYLRAGASLSVSPLIALRASLLGAVALPEGAISFAGRQVATFGRPLLLGSGGLEITLP